MKWLWAKATGKFGIGSQSGKCGCGCQLAPSRPNEPQPSGRTPKLCCPDSWWTTYKRQESSSNKSARHKKWMKKGTRQRWQEEETRPTRWRARLVRWEIHDYRQRSKKQELTSGIELPAQITPDVEGSQLGAFLDHQGLWTGKLHSL